MACVILASPALSLRGAHLIGPGAPAAPFQVVRAFVVDATSPSTLKVLYGKQEQPRTVKLFGITEPQPNSSSWKDARTLLSYLTAKRTVLLVVHEETANGDLVAQVTLPDGQELAATLALAGLATPAHPFTLPQYAEAAEIARKSGDGQFSP